MKISKNTLKVLQSFAQINQSIYIEAGDKHLSTMSIDKNILGRVAIEEEFDVEFGIYNLGEFLAAVALFDDPDFDFTEKFVTISSGKDKIKYSSVEKELVVSPPKTINFPDSDIIITVSDKDLTDAIKAASVLSSPSLIIHDVGDNIELSCYDPNNSSSNTWNRVLCKNDSGHQDFEFIISIDNMKLLPQDYKLDIAAKGITKWTGVDAGAETIYYLALDLMSSFTS